MIKKNPCTAMPRSSAVFVAPIIFAVALLLLGVVQSNAETVTVTPQGDVEPVVSETKTATASKPKKSKPAFKFCPVKVCGKEPTEIEAWECLARFWFRDRPDGQNKSLNHHRSKWEAIDEKIVQHDCGGVGWGNSIRGFYDTAAVASLLGRRVSVLGPSDIFNKMFLPPFYPEVKHWDFGYSKAAERSGIRDIKHDLTYRAVFDYEAHGRPPDRFGRWASSLRKNGSTYNTPILMGGVCGGDRDFVISGSCLTHAMPKFGRCLRNMEAEYYMHEPLMSVPFFHKLFSKPSPLMVEKLALVRERLHLPPLDPGLEPTKGAWGLRTPGYYILAMHFRRVPLGFEPMANEMNVESQIQFRQNVLAGFWKHAERYAKQARDIAKCRKQKLLLYFATDATKFLRPEAEKRLSKYGQVVFGLLEDEVGHVSPQWMQRDTDGLEKEIDKVIAEQVKKGLPAPSRDSVALAVKSSPAEVELHGVMSMVEWWILAHSNWLISHSGTSYSDTAAGVGLGPQGIMERIDVVHSEDHATTSFRRDWEGDSCTPVGAAEKEHRQTCPNKRRA